MNEEEVRNFSLVRKVDVYVFRIDVIGSCFLKKNYRLQMVDPGKSATRYCDTSIRNSGQIPF